MENAKNLCDPVGRRRRNAPRQPARQATANERDIHVLTFIHRYGGMLTTDIIFRYAQLAGIYKNKPSLSRRLKELYHDAGLLDRPTQQRQIEYPERFNLVHRVSEQGEELLKAHRLFSEYAPRPYGAYEHQMMTACVYACYYLNAKEHGIGVTPQHELLATVKRNGSIVIDGKTVTPDALFMLTVGEKQVLVFLEIDRATEVGHSTDDKRKSWGRSVEQYQKIIGEKQYKEHYGVSVNCGAQVHVITTKFAMQQKILRQVERVLPKGCAYVLTHTSNAFGEIFHSPTYMEVLKVAWDRSGHSPFQFLK